MREVIIASSVRTPVGRAFKGTLRATRPDELAAVAAQIDAGNRRVLVLPADSRKQTQLAFTDLDHPTGLTVDSARTVYVTDSGKNRVVALDAGSNRQYQLPFNGLNGPTGLVVGRSVRVTSKASIEP